MKTALLCPTRARPDQLRRMMRSAKATAGDISIYVAQTAKIDTYMTDYLAKFTMLPDGMPTAYKWNLLAEEAMKDPANKLFMLCADDVIFSTPLWDKSLIDHYNALDNKIHVYALLDSRDVDGTPHPIVTREYIEAMGYFLPPIFLHWFVDTWTVEIAKANNCFTHLKDYQLIHDKPSDKGQGDATHTGIRSMGWHSRDQYVWDKCQHFLQIEKKRLGEKFV